eukprot:474845-Pleurochrysis_carterae.AAC.2
MKGAETVYKAKKVRESKKRLRASRESGRCTAIAPSKPTPFLSKRLVSRQPALTSAQCAAAASAFSPAWQPIPTMSARCTKGESLSACATCAERPGDRKPVLVHTHMYAMSAGGTRAAAHATGTAVIAMRVAQRKCFSSRGGTRSVERRRCGPPEACSALRSILYTG